MANLLMMILKKLWKRKDDDDDDKKCSVRHNKTMKFINKEDGDLKICLCQTAKM